MSALDTSRYFHNPKLASFVKDVQRGDVARVRTALAAGLDPNAKGEQDFRPIYFALFAKDADVLELLLAAGADPNSPLTNGNTPLHFSVRSKIPDFTRVLLRAGADPNGRGENKKPHIHEAIDQPDAVEQVKLLGSAGADLNAIWGGGTPVMRALEVGRWEVAATLIDLGADLGFKNSFGETALDLTCRFMAGLPANEANKKGITAVARSLKLRNRVLPCKDEVDRFR